MKRSGYTWLLFALCVLAVLAAMGWASHTVLRLQRAQAEAVRQAAVEERVRLALWRMDSALTPLIALENARPYFDYTAFYPLDRAYTRMYSEILPEEVLVPSPLLPGASPNIILHFQFGPDGELSSPQAPTGNMRDLAEIRYVPHDRVEAAAAKLKELGGTLSRGWLLAALGKEAGEAAPPPLQEARLLVKGKPFDEQQKALNVQEYQARNVSRQQAVNVDNTLLNTAQGPPQSKDVQQAQGDQQRRGPSPPQPASQPAQAPQQQAPSQPVVQGEMTALWNGSALVLARTVSAGGRSYVQGCWLDWPGIREWLLASVADLLPKAELAPASGDGAGHGARMLANLPVRLVPGAVPGVDGLPPSPLWMSLAIAWGCVVLAAAVAARVLQRAITLSERRGAFVSAVTHEMRTPLTTFRMYTEMLSEGMVADERRRRKYLDVLLTEADRLSHLVENVLAYARLEGPRSAARAETVALGELLERVEPRLSRRAALAGMQLVIEPPAGKHGAPDDAGAGSIAGADGAASAAGPAVRADISAVEQVLMNLVDNACKYAARPVGSPDRTGAADRRIHLRARVADGRALIAIRDHGPGIPPAKAGDLFQPFRKSAHQAAESAPGIGLGLALSRRLARNMGGDLRLEDSEGGACFVLSLPLAGP